MTDHQVEDQRAAASVRLLAPDAIDAFAGMMANVASVANAELIELVRRRVSTLLGADLSTSSQLTELPIDKATALSSWPTSQLFSDVERCCLGFAEQFVMDVSATTDSDRHALDAALGPDMFGFVQALYVLDHGIRLRLAVTALFGVDPFAPLPAGADSQLWPALEIMMGAVARLDALDPLTAEVVRLRGARAHQCRLCTSRRRVSALESDDGLLDDVAPLQRANLRDRERLALAVTDAMLLHPADLGDQLVAHCRETFSPAALIEIPLLVAHNAANKIAVALAADTPHVSEGLEYFEISDDGTYRYGLTPSI